MDFAAFDQSSYPVVITTVPGFTDNEGNSVQYDPSAQNIQVRLVHDTSDVVEAPDTWADLLDSSKWTTEVPEGMSLRILQLIENGATINLYRVTMNPKEYYVRLDFDKPGISIAEEKKITFLYLLQILTSSSNTTYALVSVNDSFKTEGTTHL